MLKKIMVAAGIAAAAGLCVAAAAVWQQQQAEDRTHALWAQQRAACEDGSDTGDFAGTVAQCQAALATLQQIQQPGPLDRARGLMHLSKALYETGDHQAALGHASESLALLDALPPPATEPASDLQATVLNHMGRTYYRWTEEYNKAEAYFDRALVIWQQSPQDHDGQIAAALNNLAALHFTRDDYPAAEAGFRRALALREKTLKPNDSNIGESYYNLASTLEWMERYPEADAAWARCFAIYAHRAPGHPDPARAFLAAGELMRDRETPGSLPRAEAYLLKAMDSAARIVDGRGAVLAQATEALATVYDEMGRSKDAKKLRAGTATGGPAQPATPAKAAATPAR